MSDETFDAGCEEYNTLARRDFLQLATGVGVAAMLPAWLPQVVLA
ncbi:MAG: twin-arginine translocation signal domain-containing protein, partial [Gemmatimonadaceae bacterium]